MDLIKILNIVLIIINLNITLINTNLLRLKLKKFNNQIIKI